MTEERKADLYAFFEPEHPVIEALEALDSLQVRFELLKKALHIIAESIDSAVVLSNIASSALLDLHNEVET